MQQLFLGVMDFQEAKNHQYKLKTEGVILELKTNKKTCTTGCKITVEVWADEKDERALRTYFQNDFMKHVSGHEINFDHLSAIFDTNASEVTCQACGSKFSPQVNECPECGLVY